MCGLEEIIIIILYLSIGISEGAAGRWPEFMSAVGWVAQGKGVELGDM